MKLPQWVRRSAFQSRPSVLQRSHLFYKFGLKVAVFPAIALSQTMGMATPPGIAQLETSAVESPALESPAVESPALESPVIESPAVASPAPDSPVSESPVSESPVSESPASESPVPESPVPENLPTSEVCSPDTQFATAQVTQVRSPDSPVMMARTSNMGDLLNDLSPVLAAHFAAPFPQISGAARRARVPVIMYHDILPEKEVFFDVTPQEFTAALNLIRENGLTPISLDQLTEHLATGVPLPEKPILLTFDDGYKGHYEHVYPLLKQYGYPAVFAIYPDKVGTNIGRSSMSWEQLQEMAADPLVTIASHSFTHPEDLTVLPDDRLRYEIVESKRVLESKLGITLKYFVYPVGKNDERVQRWVQMTGYKAALTMDDTVNKFAGESESLLSIDRIGQSNLAEVIPAAYGGAPLPPFGSQFNFNSPVQLSRLTVNEVPLIMASGGRPITIHAKTRYQVEEIIAGTPAVAAVDGGFFSLEYLDSNVMVGPVMSQNTQAFMPSNPKEVRLLTGRPLVLLSPDKVMFVPFDPEKHNTLAGIQAELPDATDAFVGAAWLVKDGQPQPAEAFGRLFDFDAARDRAYWGIDYAGQPVVGVSGDYVDSVSLGKALSKAGLRDVVMLDSGASASLVYEGKSMMSYEPRPVPHVVALLPPQPTLANCSIVSKKQAEN